MQTPQWILWNIFLAVIPVLTAYLLAAGIDRWTLKNKSVAWPVWLPVGLFWFAFLPNTCYLLTEWRHFLFDPYFTWQREAGDNSPAERLAIARQGLFFLLYSSAGVLCYGLSIRPIEQVLRRANVNLVLPAIPFFLLTSLGVYMGLIRRLNSWQLVTQPRLVWEVTVHAVTTPLLFQTIVVFAVLLWILYRIVDIWLDGVAQRLRDGYTGSSPRATAGSQRPASNAKRRAKS